MARLIPGARYEVVPDCGHAVHREAPGELLELVQEFLA